MYSKHDVPLVSLNRCSPRDPALTPSLYMHFIIQAIGSIFALKETIFFFTIFNSSLYCPFILKIFISRCLYKPKFTLFWPPPPFFLPEIEDRSKTFFYRTACLPVCLSSILFNKHRGQIYIFTVGPCNNRVGQIVHTYIVWSFSPSLGFA